MAGCAALSRPTGWMNLQKNYELRLAEQEIGEALQKIPQHHGGGKASDELPVYKKQY